MPKTISLDRQYTKQTTTLSGLLLEIFGSNDYYAMAKTVGGEITYQPIKKKLTTEIIQEHLDGKIVIGTYQLDQSSNVSWIGWDVDSSDREIAKKYAEKIILRLKDIPHVVEFSGAKGYHILIFLSKSMPAERAKIISDYIRDSEGLPRSGTNHVECYPKQPAITKSMPMGSLLKLPLGLHPRTHNRSVFVDHLNGWEAGKELPALELLQHKVSPEELDSLLQESTDIRKQLKELLIPHWTATSGEHHNFALYLSGYFAHLGWGLEDAVSLITEIAQEAGDQELHNRKQAVEDTFRNVEQGRNVKGFSGLNDMLPGSTMKVLIELATQIVTPTLVRRIDSIRLKKGATFEKIRAAGTTIWADLVEKGEIVQTGTNKAYWFCSEDHLLTALDSLRWQALLHKNYGINPTESFGTQVTEELRLRAISEARIIEVQNKTVWTGEKLLVNLGNSLVYELTGDDIITSFNGECGYLFQTSMNADNPIIPDFKKPIDIWSKIVDDLSFNKSENAPATPAEQANLLKAWILAYFFQELMPTKPLLLALGMPGSGKTTAMRRIMKILESLDSEVLEIVQDKPDSLRASLSSHRLLVLDNLEKSNAKWLVDMLNRLATGSNIELRQLYKTNDVYVIKPQCFVAMTAVNMPFSEETLFSRILPLEFQQLANPLPEYLIQKSIIENIHGVWADLLLKLNQIVATLKRDTTQLPPIASRLADFTVFCKRIEHSGVLDGAVLIRGLRSLVDRQRMALLEASPFVTVLEEWLNSQAEDKDKFHTFVELFSILEPLAHMRKLSWRWSNPAALSRHVLTMADPLKRLYGAEIKEAIDGHGKTIHQVKFSAAL